jgi:uncharacterized SAM-binding protein YcdF (DUF218 family)
MGRASLQDSDADAAVEPPGFAASRDAITRFLFVRDAPRAVDLCLVLGSATLSSMAPAIDLYRRGLTPYLLISGHGPSPDQTPEWRIYRDFALEQGVPAHAILIEPHATNTKENFSFSNALIAERLGWEAVRTVAVVGKPYHMRRALMTARRQWPHPVDLLMLPCDHPDDPSAEGWWLTEEGRHWVFRELAAIGAYAASGDLGGF